MNAKVKTAVDSFSDAVYHRRHFRGGDAMRWLVGLLVLAAPVLEAQTAARYDSVLAQRAGADRIGMKVYVLALLKAGPHRNQDSLEAVRLQAAHMANINRMAAEGSLVLAGPFLEDGDLRGIYVFDVRTLEEARALTETDPAVKAGRLAMELHLWYGSAALMEVPRIHNTLQRR
jgi:uncharacterized protein YciI